MVGKNFFVCVDSESNHFQVSLPSPTMQKRLANTLQYDLVLSDEKAKKKGKKKKEKETS